MITEKEVYKFLLDALNQACQNGIDMERAKIKAEWDKLRKYLDNNYGITLEDEKLRFNEFEKKVFEK